MCAPDGYIYECYTGFPANWNDSEIMLHILETDKELIRICKPEKTVFILDRGIFTNLLLKLNYQSY